MKTAICAIIKDEHRFLKEWIDWHLNLGFDVIHLFEDKGSESHEEIVKDYSNVFLRRYETDKGIQELLKDQGSSHTQYVLYTWFANEYKGVYDRVAFIDLDEFIFFAEDYNLKKLCDEFELYPAVLLNWKMIGASGRISRPSCGVIEAYTQECDFCDNDYNWAYKSFVNLNRFNGFYNLHVANGFVNTHHSDNKFEYHYDKAWLNHYFTKSFEDWNDRIYKRGGTLNGHRTLAQFFECNKNMKYIESIVNLENIPKGTYWLNKSKGIIAGGNVNKIRLLNNSYKFSQTNLTDDERLNIAINNAKKIGFNNQIKTDNLIHIIWLGKNKFPEIVEKCIKSWQKYLTNYTICFWDEDSVDMNHKFVKTAYCCGNMAMASDYLRLKTVYTYGGIYLDTDIELIKPLVGLPKNWFAIEKVFNTIGPGLGFGAEKGNEILKDLFSMYDYFTYTDNGEYKQKMIINSLITNYFISRGWEFKDELYNFLGFTLFPSEYFSPKHFYNKEIDITDNTYTIHHYTCLWH